VEFALVAPPFLMFLVGIMSASVLVFSAASMHFAAEAAARSYSVSGPPPPAPPNQCGSAATAQSYAQSQYYGVSSPTFTASTVSCGCQVNATLSLVLDAGMARWTVPLSTTACFPLTY
jgi:Flp pilus assembly protein TadG